MDGEGGVEAPPQSGARPAQGRARPRGPPPPLPGEAVPGEAAQAMSSSSTPFVSGTKRRTKRRESSAKTV